MRLLLAAALLLAAPLPAAAQGDTSPFRTADRFFENCDARPDASGQRPEENYLCLSYMSGLIEGYGIAAFANGNERPYCLPRPVTLVEMMDIMAVAIERGVPPGTPTAVVFHNLLTVTFPCDRRPGAAGLSGGTPEATDPTAGEPAPGGAAADGSGADGSGAVPTGAGRPMAPGAPVVGAPEGPAADTDRPAVPPAGETPGSGLPAAPDAPVVGAPEGVPSESEAESETVPGGTPEALPESEAETETEAVPEAETAPEVGAEAEAEAIPEAEPMPEAAADAEATPDATPDAAPEDSAAPAEDARNQAGAE